MPYVATHHPPATPPAYLSTDPGSERPAEWDRAFRASAQPQGAHSATKSYRLSRRSRPPFENILRGPASENLTIPTFRPRGLSAQQTDPSALKKHRKIHAYLPPGKTYTSSWMTRVGLECGLGLR